MNAKANLAYIIPSNEKAPYMFSNVTAVELYFYEQEPKLILPEPLMITNMCVIIAIQKSLHRKLGSKCVTSTN